ncbi:glycosyltransferase family 4 protein [Flavobacterium okayamense]|uniref:Glycosyl transferase family 1 domain-containing protein n=1 Tax=Flavobacterium okayamense TaxID=2830782 RepID=A0ABM7S5Q0_9FLAO|nr:glycosyltransferase family 4 protein [Flavobacterium okayamense]BCY28720.1 hypothetical protein KK2020170_15880 [Flavobacterium okayamense]
MKVLLINNFSQNLLVGGVENYLVELLKYNHSIYSEIEFYWYGRASKKTNWIQKFYNYSTTSEIKRIIDTFKPDLIHCFGIGAPITPHFMKYAKHKNIPILFSFRDYYYQFNKNNTHVIELDPKKNFIYNILISAKRKYHKELINKHTSYFLTPSNQLTEAVKQNFKLKGETLHNPVLVTNKTSVNNEEFILYVGRIEKGKGVLTLVESFAEVLNEFPNEKLVLVGEGTMQKNIEDFIKKNSLENNISLVGKKLKSELEYYYSKSKFVILPSEILEGYGNVVLEAHAYGKAVIISDFVGVKDEVLKYNSGLVFSHENVSELTNQIKKLLIEDILKHEFAENGKKFIADRTMESHFKDLVKIYKRLLF